MERTSLPRRCTSFRKRPNAYRDVHRRASRFSAVGLVMLTPPADRRRWRYEMAIELNNHMGLFHIDIELLPAEGGAPRRHRVLVDTGAAYLALPRGLVASLGYQPIDHQHVVFATGQTATWEVAEVRVRLEGRERTVLAF